MNGKHSSSHPPEIEADGFEKLREHLWRAILYLGAQRGFTTQKEIAKAVGKREPQISSWKNKNMMLDNLFIILIGLGCDLVDLALALRATAEIGTGDRSAAEPPTELERALAVEAGVRQILTQYGLMAEKD